jgi:hypothetical protein
MGAWVFFLLFKKKIEGGKWGVGFFLIKHFFLKKLLSLFLFFFHSCRWGEGANGFF